MVQPAEPSPRFERPTQNSSDTSPGSDGSSRHPLESIASDFAESIREGKQGSIDKIADSNPDMETELRDLLPVIHQLERARQSQVHRPGGLASLGAERPDHLGDFELVRQIGRGGMGVVFEAVQQSLGRRVAVKVLPKSLLSDGAQLKRFEREARMAGSLHHTNIVPVFGVGEDQGFHYYVMQRIDGRGLDRLISDETIKLTPNQVASLGRQAASALAYAHEQNVLHRDIKPANLVVNQELQLWVADFGVAKAIESEAVTRTGDVVGTLRYMAPEQIVGESDVRSDIYSLGVTLYELLAGRPAMDDTSIREALVARRPAPTPPRLRQLNPDVPRDLETILHTAMAVDSSNRYQTAAELSADLARFLDGEPISVRRLSFVELGLRWARRNPAIASLSALSLLLVTSVAVLSTIGFFHVQNSLDREQNTRRTAEATAELATGALNQIFDRFANDPDEQRVATEQFASTPALSDEAAELLEDLLHYYDALAARSDFDKNLRRSAVDARYAMGDIHFQLGNYQRAIEAFEASLDESVDARDVELQGLREARILNRIGFAHRMTGDVAKARQAHEKSLNLLTAIAADSDEASNEVQFELSRTHYLLAAHIRPGMGPMAMPPIQAVMKPDHLGNTPPHRRLPHHSLQLSPEDRSHLDSAIETLQRLRGEAPKHLGYALALAASLRQVESGMSKRDRDQQSSGAAIRLLRELQTEHPNSDAVRFELSESLADMGVFEPHMTRHELEEDISRLRDAFEHLEALASLHPNVPKYTNAVAHAAFKIGVLLERSAEKVPPGMRRELEQEAGMAFRTAADRYGILIERHPDAVGYLAWHALFLQYQGGNALKTGLLEQAEQSLSEAIEIWKGLIESNPKERISWHALPVAYELVSHAQHRLNKHFLGDESRKQAEMSRLYRDMEH